MSRCVDAPRAGVTGCGAEWDGTTVAHCVARHAASPHVDGRCHETFSSCSASDLHWVGIGGKRGRGAGKEVHTSPELIPELEKVARANGAGVWTPRRTAQSGGSGDETGVEA